MSSGRCQARYMHNGKMVQCMEREGHWRVSEPTHLPCAGGCGQLMPKHRLYCYQCDNKVGSARRVCRCEHASLTALVVRTSSRPQTCIHCNVTWQRCDYCMGSGREAGRGFICLASCVQCKGAGYIVVPDEH